MLNNNSPIQTPSEHSFDDSPVSLPFGYDNYIDDRTLTRLKRELARARRSAKAGTRKSNSSRIPKRPKRALNIQPIKSPNPQSTQQPIQSPSTAISTTTSQRKIQCRQPSSKHEAIVINAAAKPLTSSSGQASPIIIDGRSLKHLKKSSNLVSSKITAISKSSSRRIKTSSRPSSAKSIPSTISKRQTINTPFFLIKIRTKLEDHKRENASRSKAHVTHAYDAANVKAGNKGLRNSQAVTLNDFRRPATGIPTGRRNVELSMDRPENIASYSALAIPNVQERLSKEMVARGVWQ